ncbi:hypothetical protein D9M69_600010 [compost metagenome]
MSLLRKYLRPIHTSDCDCPVCFAGRLVVLPVTESPCPNCQPPGRPFQAYGRWFCRPRVWCTKHQPPRRPPQYWQVVYDSGPSAPELFDF